MQNPENGSVSRLITDLKTGDHEAARQIWQRYYENIVRLARSRLREVPRAMADEEDAALSILNSFFCGAAAGRFPILENREDLWRILMTITTRKAIKLAQYEGRLKRGGRRVFDEARMVAASMESNGALDQFQVVSQARKWLLWWSKNASVCLMPFRINPCAWWPSFVSMATPMPKSPNP